MKPKLTKLSIEGAYNIDNFRFIDDRGEFISLSRKQELPLPIQNFNIENVYISNNTRKGTLRGFHKQLPPYEETKILTCIKGCVLHIIARMNPLTEEIIVCTNQLNEEMMNSTYVPGDCFSAFITLEDLTQVVYTTNGRYEPDFQDGINWKSKCFQHIDWPILPTIISTKDANLRYG